MLSLRQSRRSDHASQTVRVFMYHGTCTVHVPYAQDSRSTGIQHYEQFEVPYFLESV